MKQHRLFGTTRRSVLVGMAATLAPGARAQQRDGMRRLGVLMPGNETTNGLWLATVVHALGDLGWVEGSNFKIVIRWAGGQAQNYASLATELVAAEPDVILSPTTGVTISLQHATSAIPIVFVLVSDPVGQKVVASLPHPGGNVTGFSWIDFTIAGKALEFLKELAPSIIRVGVLFNPKTAPQGEAYVRFATQAGKSLGIQIGSVSVDRTNIESAIAAMSNAGRSGIIVLSDPFNGLHANDIIRATAADRVPAIYFSDSFPKHGGLASYGLNELTQLSEAAHYIDRIFRGERPQNLPVQQPTKFDFIINAKTATALGLTIPTALLATADEVIE